MKAVRDIDPTMGGWLEERMIRCGKPHCRCASGHLHGPYTYLGYRKWDEQAERWRIRRRYVRLADVMELRALLATARMFRRCVRGLLKDQPPVLTEQERLRREAREKAIQRLRIVTGRSRHLLRRLEAKVKAARAQALGAPNGDALHLANHDLRTSDLTERSA